MKLLSSAAGLCAVTLVLTGCGSGAGGSSDTRLSMPPSPEQSAPAAPSGNAAQTAPGVEDAPGEQGDGQVQGNASSDPSDPSEHCVMVAGGVTTAMLAPLTLWPSSDPEDLEALELQILELRDKVPVELHADFTALAHSVEMHPKGSGEYDEQAFRDAMTPVQEWLDAHCADK